jgi:general transcription factor 3C polypeptide 3 (transcription factor C subunit 4)
MWCQLNYLDGLTSDEEPVRRRILCDLEGAVEAYKQDGMSPGVACQGLTFTIIVDADQTNNDTKMKLAEFYEIMDESRIALELIYEG